MIQSQLIVMCDNSTLHSAQTLPVKAHHQLHEINSSTWGIMGAFVLLIHPFSTMPSLE